MWQRQRTIIDTDTMLVFIMVTDFPICVGRALRLCSRPIY